MSEPEIPFPGSVDALVHRCRGLDTPEAYRSLLADLREIAAGFERSRLDRILDGPLDTPEMPPALLLRSVLQPVPDVAKLVEILQEKEGPAISPAAFCLVEHFPDDDGLAEDLLLGPDLFSPPRLRRDAHDYTIKLMGLSGKALFIPWLAEALCHRFHFCRPGLTSEALAHLGAPQLAQIASLRSISVTEGGAQIFITDDERFGGSSNCVHCRFFPCRINRYHYGAIEDCKLWNRTDPADRLEIRDFRSWRAPVPAHLRGPLPESEVRAARAQMAQGRFLDALPRLCAALAEEGEAVAAAWADLASCLLAMGEHDLARQADAGPSSSEERRSILRQTLFCLGCELERAQEHGASAAAFRSALLHADRDDDRIVCAGRAAAALARAGDPQGAYRLLLMLDREAREATDPESLSLWASTFLHLHHRLGGSREPSVLRSIRGKLPSKLPGPSVLGAEQDADLEKSLAGAGARLEELARQPALEGVSAACDLVDRVIHLYEEALLRQPGAAARRRVRRSHQPVFEAAVLALVKLAGAAGGESETGQLLLSRAWKVVLKSRNPELQVVSVPPSEEQARHLRGLEDSLHRALCHTLASPPRSWSWLEFLEKVTAYEISTLRTERGRPPEALAPPQHGVAVAFFQSGASILSGSLLVLLAHEGRFRTHLLPDTEGKSMAFLVAWARRLQADSLSGQFLRGVKRHLSLEPVDREGLVGNPDLALRKAAEVLFPEDLEGLAPGPAAVPWYVFPDAELHFVPIEILPGATEGALGDRLALRFCLRSSVAPACEEKIDFSRGWLGLGAAPALPGEGGEFSYLPGTRDEIAFLRSDLAALGFPAECLLDGEAQADRLAEHLAAKRPSVLHLAVHGIAHPEHPDACALVLAAAPGAAEKELLPFRRIRDLPLAGVQLVVLSACSSLLGPSDKSAGIEGLTWAFLQAGAVQVIASRYPVDDRDTSRLMRILYRHLLDHPVAEALRRMRLEGGREGISRREVGAWAVWS